MSTKLKKILLLFVLGIFMGMNGAFASDNVLQAVQINGVNDSYDIILKSDDVAEMQKTVQAPNKMIIVLKGIRASKTINTIYSNTSSVDSVVVEPINDETVKILIQAANVENAKINFDSLKTPLGVLGNDSQPKKSNEIILSDPMTSYRPVYEDNGLDEETTVSFGSGLAKYAKKALHSEKLNLLITFGLFLTLLASGMKLVKGKDNDIKIGLKQSLQDREIDLYKDLNVSNIIQTAGLNQQNVKAKSAGTQNASGSNYGLRAYQNVNRSPYATPEVQRPRVMAPAPKQAAPAAASTMAQKNYSLSQNNLMQNTIQKTASAPKINKQKSSNIDSMKFLESMTKIYERNGRSDLAHGLKTNMQKASKMNLV